MRTILPLATLGSLLLLAIAGPKPSRADEPKPADAAKVRVLFDGKTLDGWKEADFGTPGKVKVLDGMIVMERGLDMSGIKFTGQPLRNNFELTLEGKRLEGADFFCSTTFPIGKDHATLVVGGWGGTTVGLSCVDGLDASENPTSAYIDLKDNRWYRVRIRVSTLKVEAWIDDQKVVDVAREGRRFDTRIECDACIPLGIATWQTKGAVRQIELRELTAKELAEIKVVEE